MPDIDYPVNRSDANDPEPANTPDLRHRHDDSGSRSRYAPHHECTGAPSIPTAPSETAVRITIEARQEMNRAEKRALQERKTASPDVRAEKLGLDR